MSIILRYVNTSSTPGGNGTTNATTGIDRAYADLSEWEASEQTNLVSSGNIAEVVCSGGADVSSVNISGWVTSATSYILIHATTDKHTGIFDSSKYFFEGDSVATRFNIAQGYVRIEDLQFTRPTPASSSAARSVIAWTSSIGTQHIRRNIFKFDSNVINGVISAFSFNSSTPDYVVTDNIFDNRLASGGTNNICITGVGGTADALIYNNTFINWPLAINSKTNYIVKNNIFQDCAADITGTLNANNDYNLTDNGSIAGVNSVASSTLTFENKSGFNFALSPSDSDAIDAGIGPSGDSNVSLTDIIGVPRSGLTTDIGAFMYVSSGGLTASITESGPSFTEQISATLSKAIEASITELGPSFTESISTNLSANITGSIGESGPAFTESISATLSTLTIQGNITESGPSFTDSISVDVQASVGLNASIAELGPSFTESVQASLDKAIEANISEYGPSFTDSIAISLTSEIDASIGEYGPSFIEGLSAKIPVKISVNAKNTIKVKRSANTVKIKRKSNILRVK